MTKKKKQDSPVVAWFDISAKEPDTIKTFYRELFGWPIADLDENYAVIGESEDGPSGGVGKSDSKSPYTGFVAYFEVEDVNATLRQATKLGAKTVLEPTDAPDGRLAVFEDVEGNLIGLTTS